MSIFALVMGLMSVTVVAMRPNIVFLLADDTGHGDLAFSGATYSTPHLDSLKESGLNFDRYYLEPECTPTRSSLMSGRYPHSIGTQRAFSGGSNATLPVNLTLLPNVLKMGGYDTYLVGKWHLGYLDWSYTPHRRGFDDFVGIFQGDGEQYTHDTNLNNPCGSGQVSGYDFWQNTTLFNTTFLNDTEKYAGFIYRQKGLQVISEHAANQSANPFFLVQSFQTSHTPYSYPPKAYPECDFPLVLKEIRAGTNNIGKFCSTIKYMDETVGEIVSLLKSTGLWNNTVVIFSTDNGGIPFNYSLPSYSEAGEASNGQFRGAKGCIFEGSVHGLGFVSGGLLPASMVNKTSSALFHVADWFPTLADMVGLSVSGITMDGMSQRCVIEGSCLSARSEMYVGMDVGPTGAAFGWVNGSFWKYVVLTTACEGTFFDFSHHRTGVALTKTPCGSPLSDPFVNPFNATELLFNLSDDPSECVNVIVANKAVAEALKQKLDAQPVVAAIQAPGGGTICPASPANNNGVWTPIYGSQFLSSTPTASPSHVLVGPTSSPTVVMTTTAVASGGNRVESLGVRVLVAFCLARCVW